MKRILLALLLVGCGGEEPIAPPDPEPISVDGLWARTFDDGKIIELSLIASGSGIAGCAAVNVIPNQGADNRTIIRVVGSLDGSIVTLTQANGYPPFGFSGSVTATSLAGRVTGFGWTDQQATLTRDSSGALRANC